MPEWLLNRLLQSSDQPAPRFAVQSTLNWMRSLAILVQSGFTPVELREHYSSVQRRAVNVEADTRVFERLLMARHHAAAVKAMSSAVANPYSVVRAAIVAWYYTIYESSSAMTLAASGFTAEQHAKTARVWHADVVRAGLALGPFALHLDTLVASAVKSQVLSLRAGSRSLLTDVPQAHDQAWGAACAYLSGTADYEKWRVEERIRKGSEFRALGVDSFRSRPARELRDRELARGHVNFLVQAFRYRGKANYRDSIYLSYGPDREASIRQFLSDLALVGQAFLDMASEYASRRVERSSWEEFLRDVAENSRFDS